MREGWEYKKLGDLCDIISGRNQKDVESVDGAYPIYGSGGIMGHATAFLCEAGTTIVGRKGTINKPLYVSERFWNVDTAFGLQPKDTTDSKFLFYLCKSIDFTKYDKSVTIPSLVKKDLLKIDVCCPPLTTQQQIVSELDLLSHILDQKRQQLKEYDALAESIFFDMFGDPVENPKGWEVKKLESLVSINSKLVDPKTAPYCEMYHVGPANIISGTGEIVDVKKAKEETLISGKYIFEEGMILYSKIRPALNKVALANMHGLCSADMYPLSPNIEIVNAFFLKYVLSGPAFLKYAIEQSGRARMPKINREALFAFEFPLPPLSLQQSFAAKIQSIEHQKQLLRASIKETEMLFQSRMDYWFNG